jgi:hypothetical protein
VDSHQNKRMVKISLTITKNINTMKNKILVLIFSIFSMTLFSQTLTFDTTYISFNTVDSAYLLTTEQHFDDFSETKIVKPIGRDSATVISMLVNKIKRRKNKEARGVLEAYNYRGLTSDAALLKKFSGMSYYKNLAAKISSRFVGTYRVWINGTAHDATMGITGAGNMRLYIPGVANYTVLLQSPNSFIIRNYTPDSVTFYFINETNNRRLYMNNDFEAGWKIKFLHK